MLDDAAKFDNSPPETLISSSIKSVDASESVKISDAFWKAFKLSTSDVIAIVGGVVSAGIIVMVCDAELALPPASVAVAVTSPEFAVFG